MPFWRVPSVHSILYSRNRKDVSINVVPIKQIHRWRSLVAVEYVFFRAQNRDLDTVAGALLCENQYIYLALIQVTQGTSAIERGEEKLSSGRPLPLLVRVRQRCQIFPARAVVDHWLRRTLADFLDLRSSRHSSEVAIRKSGDVSNGCPDPAAGISGVVGCTKGLPKQLGNDYQVDP